MDEPNAYHAKGILYLRTQAQFEKTHRPVMATSSNYFIVRNPIRRRSHKISYRQPAKRQLAEFLEKFTVGDTLRVACLARGTPPISCLWQKGGFAS